MSHRLPLPLLFLVAAFLLAVPARSAEAKDLRKRPGVGFNNQNGSYSALSFRYGIPTPDPVINVLAEITFGFAASSADDSEDGLYAGGRMLYGVVAEDNLNLYAAGGAGLLLTEGETLVRLTPGLSAEFFLFGVENLGFSAEWGVAVDLGAPTGIATFGAVPGVGVHYYF